jgi:hypothetical protein
MTRSLVEKYRMGMITDDHLMIESLRLVVPENPGLVLSGLPESILRRISQFTHDHPQRRLLTNYGVLPTQDQIQAAGDWIEKSLQHEASAS